MDILAANIPSYGFIAGLKMFHFVVKYQLQRWKQRPVNGQWLPKSQFWPREIRYD